MTGWVTAYGVCLCCRRPFSFNPRFVPSHRMTPDSDREPVCRECMEAGNRIRAEHKLPPLEIHPEAYEPLPAEEL